MVQVPCLRQELFLSHYPFLWIGNSLSPKLPASPVGTERSPFVSLLTRRGHVSQTLLIFLYPKRAHRHEMSLEWSLEQQQKNLSWNSSPPLQSWCLTPTGNMVPWEKTNIVSSSTKVTSIFPSPPGKGKQVSNLRSQNTRLNDVWSSGRYKTVFLFVPCHPWRIRYARKAACWSAADSPSGLCPRTHEEAKDDSVWCLSKAVVPLPQSSG